MADTANRTGPTQLTAAAVTQRTIPAATTGVLRSVHVANVDTVPRSFRLSIGADASGTRLWHDQVVPPGGSFDWSGFMPVLTGEIVQAYASAASALDLTLGWVDLT